MTSTATTQNNRRGDDEVRNFEASPQLTAHLQRVLVDLIELHIQGKQVHWNVVGANFRDPHLQLDEVVDTAREASDTIAERMRALGVVPDGRSDTVAFKTTLPQFPAFEQSTAEVVDLITTRAYATVDTLRALHRRRGPQHRRSAIPDHRLAGEACLDDQVGEPQDLSAEATQQRPYAQLPSPVHSCRRAPEPATGLLHRETLYHRQEHVPDVVRIADQ